MRRGQVVHKKLDHGASLKLHTAYNYFCETAYEEAITLLVFIATRLYKVTLLRSIEWQNEEQFTEVRCFKFVNLKLITSNIGSVDSSQVMQYRYREVLLESRRPSCGKPSSKSGWCTANVGRRKHQVA